MIFCILSLILLRNKDQRVHKEENTITVKNFYDYNVNMKNENDILKIILPENTFVFISSIDGYQITVYESNKIGDMVPDSLNRLIYFKNEGSIEVISKKPSLIFKFHTLPINKFENLPKNNNFIISTKVNNDLCYMNGRNAFRSYYHINDIPHDALIWFITDVDISCKIVGNCYYYIANINEDSDEIIARNSFSGGDLFGKSKLIEFVFENYSGSYLFKPQVNQETKIDYYDNYQAFVNKQSLDSTKIIERGKDRLDIPLYIDQSYKIGENYYDFSLSTKLRFSLFSHLVAFPYNSTFGSGLPEDDVCGMAFYTNGYNMDLVSFSNKMKEEDINFKFLIIKLKGIETLVSSRPNEYIKIGTSFDSEVNYSSDFIDIEYVMMSFQDIETNVFYNGTINITCVLDNCIDENDIESDIKIRGPFTAFIHKGTACEFITTPKSQLKEGFNDKLHVYLEPTSNYISSKYGIFYVYDARNSNDKKHEKLFKSDAIRIFAYNFVFIDSDFKWEGEIDKQLVPENNIFGSNLERRSFYISGTSECNFLIKNYDWRIDYLNFITQRIDMSDSNLYQCEKIALFNQYPMSFTLSTSQKKDSIHIIKNETLCMIPYYREPSSKLTGNSEKINTRIYGPDGSEYEYPNKDGLQRGLVTIDVLDENANLNINFNSSKHFSHKNVDFYAEFTVNHSSGIHYIMNQNVNSDPIEDDSEYFEGSEFVIRKSGYKFVDMKNLQTIKIICPPSSLLYIHNIYGIEVDLLNDDGTKFGYINEKSIDRIIDFYYGGQAIITRRTNDVELFFSYFVHNLKYRPIYICSDPNTNIKIGRPVNNTDSFNFTFDDPSAWYLAEINYLWFTYPYDVNFILTKNLPQKQYAQLNNEKMELIFKAHSEYDGKTLTVGVSDGYLESDDFYTEVNVSLVQTKELSDTKYDIVNMEMNIGISNNILKTKPPESYIFPTEKPPKDDNLGIIVVIICCVGGALLIAGIITAVICVKKRKKKQESSNENDNNDKKNEEI